MSKSRLRMLVRNFIIELALYGLLVAGYFLGVLQWLKPPVVELFHRNLAFYAAASLLLILFQGVVLEAVTSFLISRLGLERLE